MEKIDTFCLLQEIEESLNGCSPELIHPVKASKFEDVISFEFNRDEGKKGQGLLLENCPEVGILGKDFERFFNTKPDDGSPLRFELRSPAPKN